MRNLLKVIGLVVAIVLLVIYLKATLTSGETKTSNVLYDGKVVENAHWSPDGTKITFQDLENHLWLMDIKTRKRKELIDSPNVIISQNAWVSPTQLIVVEYVVVPKEQYSLNNHDVLLLDTSTNQQSIILKNQPLFITISVNQNRVYLGKTSEGVVEFDLKDPRSLTKVQIPTVQGYNFKLVPHGDKIAYLDGDSSTTRNKMFIYDLKTRQTNRFETLRNYKIDQFAWSSDGKQIAFLGSAPTDDQSDNLYVANLDQSKPPQPIAPNEDVADLEWSPTGDTLLIETVGQPGHNQLMLLPIPDETK